MSKKYKIYKLTCPGGEIYIGQSGSKNLKDRWNYGNGYHGDCKISNAIKKYGWKNISKEILYTDLTKEEANLKEIELIDEYGGIDNPNILNANTGGDKGYSYSKDSLSKMSESTIKLYKNHPEIKEKISNTVKQSYINNPDLHYVHATPITQFSIDGNYISSYKSIIDAESSTGVPAGSISLCVNEKTFTAGGFRWYPDDGKIRPLLQYKQPPKKTSILKLDKDTGEVIDRYDSITEAALLNGIKCYQNIIACYKGKTSQCHGFKWKKEEQ